MEPRTCACGTAISARSRTGRCGRCAARDPEVIARKAKRTPEQRERMAASARAMTADPEIVAKRTARMIATMRDPAARQRHAEGCRSGKRRQLSNPAEARRMQEAGMALAAHNATAPDRNEVHARSKETLRRRKLAWCLEAYWPLNSELKARGIKLEDRKRMIADQVKADDRVRLAALSPFQRQMERVAAGAQLTTKFTPRRADHDFTLGGVSGGMLA